MSPSIERAARNEALFREANERIEERLEELDLAEGRSPFLCECDDMSCTAVVLLTRAEYESVRASPTTFVISPGHSFSAGRVIRRESEFFVLEKFGKAGEIAEETDPRQ